MKPIRSNPTGATTTPRPRLSIEIMIMLGLLVICLTGLMLIGFTTEPPAGGMDGRLLVSWMVGFFLISFAIAIVSVTAGIGGGVLFTPFMLAFTPVDSLIVRGTGLIVAMFSGLISTGRFMQRGLANLKVCIYACVGYGIGAFIGSASAIRLAAIMGEEGEGFIRLALGGILLGLVVFFLRGGKKIEWPDVPASDRFTASLHLSLPYYEASLGRVMNYTLHRAGFFFMAIMLVGILGGFFGMGAGWAIVPTQNLVMGVPLKVAAANSGVLLGMGDCIAVWPYIHSGAVIPLFAAPWLVGQVLGGLIGTRLLISVRSGFVRLLLIGFMGFSAYGLLARGLNSVGWLPAAPMWVTGVVFVLIFSAVIVFVIKESRKPEDA